MGVITISSKVTQTSKVEASVTIYCEVGLVPPELMLRRKTLMVRLGAPDGPARRRAQGVL